jgi:hypothetical protein
MRKALTITLLTSAFGVLWMGFAQTASAGEPRVCAVGEVRVAETGTCVRLGEVDDLLGGVGDTVDDLLDDVGDLVDDLL